MVELVPEIDGRVGRTAPFGFGVGIEQGGESEDVRDSGPSELRERGNAALAREIEGPAGAAPSRFRDPYTAALGILASEWDSQHHAYQAATLRAGHVPQADLRAVIEQSAAGAEAIRDAIGKRMSATLRKHPLYSWMVAHRGFPKAVHTARLLAAIGDPLRFPGRVCSNPKGSHHLPSDWTGAECPIPVYGDGNGRGERGDAKPCGAVVGDVRRGTGVRSVWHYCGMHVGPDGRWPMQRKGVQGTWLPRVRGLLMQEGGIAEQLIRQRVEPWRGIYNQAKERIARERGVEAGVESEREGGPSPAHDSENGGGVARGREIGRSAGPAAEIQEGAVDSRAEIESVSGHPLRPFQVEKRARIIAVKAMLGDLLVEWQIVSGPRPR
jgi:hypothetical protein